LIKLGVVGLGKMGISQLAIAGAHRDVEVVAICDSSTYLLEVLGKYAKLRYYSKFADMLDRESLDAVIISTPSRLHAEMVRAALTRGLHVLCEKPFTLDANEGLELAKFAEGKKLVNQVAFHNRFVATFQEMKRLLDNNAIGDVHSFRVEAYGPVVLRPSGGTWRSSSKEGGGCLYEYASHAVDLVNFVLGRPDSVSGTVLKKIFSRGVEDEVLSTFNYVNRGINGQLVANWSDESFRRMYTRLSLWGKNGRIAADRQEIQIYLRDAGQQKTGNLGPGWSVHYTTDLTEPVDFYLRGEEYSAQIDHFVKCIQNRTGTRCSFRDAVATDAVIQMMVADAQSPASLMPKSTATCSA
jgi:predicted dehydrogenase